MFGVARNSLQQFTERHIAEPSYADVRCVILLNKLNGTSAQKGQFVPNCRGGQPAQGAKDGQRDTMHNTLRYTITM